MRVRSTFPSCLVPPATRPARLCCTRPLHSPTWQLLLALSLVSIAAALAEPLMAQDQPPQQPADEAAAAAAADFAATNDAQQQYDRAFGDWRALLKQLREVRLRYQSASSDEAAKLQAQWDALVTKGNKMIEELREKGTAAFQANPNGDPKLTQFLIKLMVDDIAADRHEPALTLGQALIDAGCDVPEVYNHAGVAAFSLDQFELAQEYLQQAANAGFISDMGRAFLAECTDGIRLWEEELQAREKDATSDLPRVKLTTNKGEIILELFEDQAPGTVGNFVNLVEQGFYDGLTFHRVIANFMAQGGCPNGDGSGGPGYEILDEVDRPDHRKHFRGSLSMAKRREPHTGGCQFFICFRPTPELNGKHTVFGRVIEGMDVVQEIQRRDPANPADLQTKPDTIVKAEVLRKRDHEYAPVKAP